MFWYYAERGRATNHGLVDELMLFDLAREGRLKPDDMVWSAADGKKWVKASTIEGLFPKDDHGNAVIHPRAEVAPHEHLQTVRERPMVLKFVAIAAGMGFVVAVGVAVYAGLRRPPAVEPPPPPPVVAVEAPPVKTSSVTIATAVIASNNVAVLVSQAVAALREERFDVAAMAVREMARFPEASNDYSNLSAQLEVLQRKFARRTELCALLDKGGLSSATAAELVQLHRERKIEPQLIEQAARILRDKKALSGNMALSVARVFFQCKGYGQARVALKEFAGRAAWSGSADDYIDAAKMCTRVEEMELGAGILEKYVRSESDSGPAWLELAAIQSSLNDTKAAFRALEAAVRFGGNQLRRKAIEDARFDNVRETRTFQRLVQTREVE